MRFLVYLLVLANLAVFIWLQTSPPRPPAERRPAAVPAGIDRLVLLSERAEVAAPRSGQPEQIEPVAPGLPRAAVSEGDELVASSIAPPDVVQQQAGAAVDEATVVAATEAAAAQAVPVEETRGAENEQAQLAAANAIEQPAQQEEPPTEPTPAGGETGVAEAPVETEPLCHTLGPFADTEVAMQVREELLAQDYDAVLRTEKVREARGYWIYLPAMPAAEARRIVADLEAHGMKDYYIGRKNYISLGIFSRKRKAERRLRQIEALGYDAVLDRRYRTRSRYWLDVTEKGASLQDSGLWQQIREAHPELELQTLACEQIATDGSL